MTPDDGREVVEIGVDGMYRSEAWSSFWHRDDARKLVAAALTAIEASGWRIVPVESKSFARELGEASIRARSASPKATGDALSQTDGAEPTPPKVRTPEEAR
jgi:hypothetical protein